MSLPREQEEWDRASQSVSLDIPQEVSDAELSLSQSIDSEVQDMDINAYPDFEADAEVAAVNFPAGIEDAERSPLPEVPTDDRIPNPIWQMSTPSPAPSYESMESDGESKDQAAKRSEDTLPTVTRVQLEEPDSPASSCYSVNSDNSSELVRKKPRSQAQARASQQGLHRTTEQTQIFGIDVQTLLGANERKHPAMTVSFMFKATLQRLAKEELTLFKWNLTRRYPECFKTSMDEHDVIDLVDDILARCGMEGSLRVTTQTLSDMKLKAAVDYLQELVKRNEAHYELKQSLKRKYECIFEGVAKQGHQTVFRNMFTELYITEGGTGGINMDHEVRILEPPRKVRQEGVIGSNDFFSSASIDQYHIRSVLSKGIAGIGKSVCVQRFVLDWAEGRDHQHIYFVLPIPFRELNLMRNEPYSLMQMIHSFFPEMRELETLDCDECKVLFICDGLDECKLPLDFRCNECWCDITQPTTLDKLMTNLIKGNLLPSAHIWITSRPFQTSRIPAECVHKLVEVRGFTDEQREEYFRKKFQDKEVANKVVEHVKSMPTLNVMCHNPLFCWITATVLDRMVREAGGKDLLKTLTRFFTHFVIIHVNMMKQKYHGKLQDKEELDREFLFKLGRLAFRMLEKGQEALSESDWRDSGVNFDETVVYSGLCTEIYREEFVMYHTKMYCFVHLCIQEYLAAFYVYCSFKMHHKNVLETYLPNKLSKIFKEPTLSDVHKCAVDKAFHSKTGHLDIFLRFLLGLSVESHQNLLRSLLPQMGGFSQGVEETVQYIQEKIRKYPELATYRKLSMCLEELRA